MNWKKLTLLGGLALALAAVPAAEAQRSGNRGEGRGSVSRPQLSAAANGGSSRAFSGRSFRGGGGDGNRRWSEHRSGNWRGGNRDGRWNNHRGGHHHRRHYYRPRYSGFYGGFGYPYGYGLGYGFGYPFYGSSASLYYNGYHPQYYAQGSNRGGSIAVEVQQELARAGYYRGAIDGVIGNGTRDAIRAYERDNGLRVDGRIDERLLDRMGLG